MPAIPSRHLGLVPAIERGELDHYFDELAEAIEAHIDLDALLLATKAQPLQQCSPIFDAVEYTAPVHLAVAKDAAFNFYYEENFELLQANGTVLHYFSPLANEEVPKQAQGLYIGGGFPEEFAEQLANNTASMHSIKKAIERGLPTLAECGGYMYLTESISNRAGESFPMVGIITGRVKMQSKLAALGYREITGMQDNFLISEQEAAKV